MKCSELKNSKDNFIVLPYSIEQFKQILLAFSSISIEKLNSKLGCEYYKDYFDTVNTKTIIIEKDYVSKDFLDDFSNYYVKCFKHYDRFCTRIHFFDTKFTIRKVNDLISKRHQNYNKSLKKFQDSYLGYIVVKHLPQSIIGKTCLKTYPNVNGERFFPALRNYDVHLCGIPLKVKTLAFQEQDSVVAACATTALWSVFQGTGKLFHHSIPSPYEITKVATNNSPDTTRSFPNHGLSVEMIAKAIKETSLEPLFIATNCEYITKATIYAYLKAKIPLIMTFSLHSRKDFNFTGKHAVALTGYNIEGNSLPPIYKSAVNDNDTGILLTSSRIQKLYAHDDQVGPFARMKFEQFQLREDNNIKHFWGMSTSWGMKNKKETFIAIPDALLVPTYHKIRIPFISILAQIYEFNCILQGFINKNDKLKQVLKNIEWDIYLTTINDFKADIINNSGLEYNSKIKICKTYYPRFIWRATLYKESKRMFDFLFDATDIEQNEYIIDVINYEDPLLLNILKDYSLLYFNKDQVSTTDNKIIKYLSALNYC